MEQDEDVAFSEPKAGRSVSAESIDSLTQFIYDGLSPERESRVLLLVKTSSA
jgi:hypothetical protein